MCLHRVQPHLNCPAHIIKFNFEGVCVSSACGPLGGVVLPSQTELQSETGRVVLGPFGEYVKCVSFIFFITDTFLPLTMNYYEMNECLGGGRLLVDL